MKEDCGNVGGKCTTTHTHNLQVGTGSGSGSGVSAGVLPGLGLSESLIHVYDIRMKHKMKAADKSAESPPAAPAMTHLCGMIFSAVSPSVMVTLRLLMYAPLWLDGE